MHAERSQLSVHLQDDALGALLAPETTSSGNPEFASDRFNTMSVDLIIYLASSVEQALFSQLFKMFWSERFVI